MIYYRVAFRVTQLTQTTNVEQMVILEPTGAEQIAILEPMVAWKWRSTVLTSPHALFTLLHAYHGLPQENIRIFFSSSEDQMDEMLSRLNQGRVSSSLTATQFIENKRIHMQDVRRLELELSIAADHDQPYTFALPHSLKERLAWAYLLSRFQMRDLIP